MLAESTLAALREKLGKAEQKLADAEKELSKAQRKADRAYEAAGDLRAQIDLERLRLWGSNPDLTELMEGDGSMVFYKALEAVAAAKGFYIGGKWMNTEQTVLRFGFNRSEIGAVERVAEGIRYFAPWMKTIKGGWVQFAVSSRDSESCAWSLRYSRVRGNAQLVREVWCLEDEVIVFKTLDEALRHIEENLWIEDIIDEVHTAVLEHAT